MVTLNWQDIPFYHCQSELCPNPVITAQEPTLTFQPPICKTETTFWPLVGSSSHCASEHNENQLLLWEGFSFSKITRLVDSELQDAAQGCWLLQRRVAKFKLNVWTTCGRVGEWSRRLLFSAISIIPVRSAPATDKIYIIVCYRKEDNKERIAH